MVKLMVIAKPKPGMTHEAFSRYWLTTHAALGKKIPGLKRYMVNIAQPGKEAPPVGGVAELWFDNATALGAGMGSPEGKAAVADLSNFADMGSVASFTVDEHTLV
jgi:uncharacterized protein (TIGR02118 family)